MPSGSTQHGRAHGDLPPARVIRQRGGVSASAVNTAILAALIITALYVGKVVFLPLAAAILVAFVLAPIVTTLRRIRIPRLIAALLVVTITFSILGIMGAIFSSQMRQLASELPRYESTLREKVRDLRGAAISSPAIERAAKTLKDLQGELEKPAPEQDRADRARDLSRIAPGSLSARSVAEKNDAGDKPIAVEIHSPRAKPLDNLIALVTPLIAPFAMVAIVVVLVVFILVQKEELRDRFIRLSGSNDMQRTTAAMTDAAHRLSRFLLTLTALNISYGAFIGAALWWLGIPVPALWGIVAALMRFVPILGSFIAALFPIILAAAVDPGWGTLIVTTGLFVVGEAMMGQVIEPLAQGKSTGLSPLAILIAAAFWTVLWGPAGLLLAIPITLCILVLGQHVEHLEFLHVLLGDDPALTHGERFYQRTLAGDATEITELAEQRMKTEPLSAYYHDVAIEGLRLAQADADRGVIAAEHMRVIEETVETMVDNLWECPDQLPQGSGKSDESSDARGPDNDEHQDAPSPQVGAANVPVLDRQRLTSGWDKDDAVLCVPAKTPVDKAAAHLLAHLVCRHGVDATVVDQHALFDGHADRELGPVRLVCVCALGEQLAAPRYLARRIARRLRGAAIIIVLMGADEDKAQDFAESWPDRDVGVASSLRMAVDAIVSRAAMGGAHGAATCAGTAMRDETVTVKPSAA